MARAGEGKRRVRSVRETIRSIAKSTAKRMKEKNDISCMAQMARKYEEAAVTLLELKPTRSTLESIMDTLKYSKSNNDIVKNFDYLIRSNSVDICSNDDDDVKAYKQKKTDHDYNNNENYDVASLRLATLGSS